MPETLRITAPDPKRHFAALCDLIPNVFSGLGYWPGRAACRETYLGNSHYDWQGSRIGMIGNTLVTHFGVWG